jgi:4a-hydroxytetrahydrobiopterin dehydratase
MPESLVEKTCLPCQGGIPPLAAAEAERLAEQVPGWSLLDGDGGWNGPMVSTTSPTP